MASSTKVKCQFCGEEKSKSGILLHETKCKQNPANKTEPKSEPKKNEIVKEVDLKQEYERMKEEIEPKKQEQEKDLVQCGSCGAAVKRGKYCSACGCEWE